MPGGVAATVALRDSMAGVLQKDAAIALPTPTPVLLERLAVLLVRMVRPVAQGRLVAAIVLLARGIERIEDEWQRLQCERFPAIWLAYYEDVGSLKPAQSQGLHHRA